VLPDAVEDPSVGEDAHVDVGHDDVVEMSLSLVGEEQVGHPHFVGVGQRQIFDFACGSQETDEANCGRNQRKWRTVAVLISEPLVEPFLAECDGRAVFLHVKHVLDLSGRIQRTRTGRQECDRQTGN
jgi:hypothetical protein